MHEALVRHPHALQLLRDLPHLVSRARERDELGSSSIGAEEIPGSVAAKLWNHIGVDSFWPLANPNHKTDASWQTRRKATVIVHHAQEVQGMPKDGKVAKGSLMLGFN